MYRIGLFLLTNIAIIVVASITLRLLGVESILANNGVDLDLGSLLVFCAVFGFAGAFVSLLLSKFMAKRFKRRSDDYKAITIPDYLQSHFKSSTNTLRIISASVLVVFVVIYVASQMDVTGIAFESMLGIDYRIGVLVGFSIVLIYIFIGGFVAAVW